MNRKERLYKLLWLQIFLGDEHEEEEEENSSDEEDNIILQTVLIKRINTRYLEPRLYRVVKSKHWWQNVLPFYDITRFKKILRMHPHSFQQLANLIRSHHVFSSQGNKPQACVEFQLAVFLCRLGSTGSLFEVCSRFGIGEGTVILYTKRVIQAILAKKKRFVKWPTSEERKKVNEGFENLGGLKNVIGAVDGTYIPMRNAPNKDPEVYFTRKKRYAIHCQGIVNDRGIFTSFDVGWPGSVHDARVYRNSSFYKDYSHLIQDDDYLLGDSAYPISPFLIPPFKDPSSRKHKKFNQFHSRHRVVIENAFGRLKARFRTLKDLDIKTVKMGVLFTCCAIILHNFLEMNMDIWEGDFNDNIEEDDNDENDNYTLRNNDEVLKRTGQAKRNLIFHQHFS
ncbi:unnamed protein product [Rhizophagus irregularis]|nr:unnamed protein product [Rhizophagus irregularis]